MCVQYYALAMVIMVAAYAIVKKDIREPNVKFQLANVKYQVVQVMVVVLKANAIVNVALKATIAANVSFIQVINFHYHFFLQLT